MVGGQSGGKTGCVKPEHPAANRVLIVYEFSVRQASTRNFFFLNLLVAQSPSQRRSEVGGASVELCRCAHPIRFWN